MFNKFKLHISPKYITLVLAVILFLLAAIVLRTDYLKIKDVVIEANQLTCTTADQIKQQVNVVGQNFLLVKVTDLENKLRKQYICLDNIKVEKKFPDQLDVNVKNRLPVALVSVIKAKPSLQLNLTEATPSSQTALLDFSVPAPAPDSLYLVDKNGVIYADSQSQDIGMPFFYLVDNSVYIGRIIDKDGLNNLLKVLDQLSKWEIYSSHVKDNQTELLIDGQPKLVFSLTKDVKEQLASLQLILEQAKMNSNPIQSDSKYINLVDLRFNKPIVIYAPKK
jgi:hypothetical protein